MENETLKFNWENFTEEDLQQLNAEKNPDIYGGILVMRGKEIFIVDVQWETVSSYSRRGISLNVYRSDKDHLHYDWILNIDDPDGTFIGVSAGAPWDFVSSLKDMDEADFDSLLRKYVNLVTDEPLVIRWWKVNDDVDWYPVPTVNVLESYTFPDSTANVFGKECRHIDSLSASELDEAYKLAKAEMDKEKESNNPALSKADDNTSKLEFAKENLGNLLTHLLDLNSNPTDQSPLDQLKGKYCSIESKLEANNIYIVVYGNISVKILIKQNPDGTYHFKRIGKVYVLGADGKYACDLPKEDLMEIEERVREDATEFESNKPSDKKASDEDDECNESETSFSPEKALESAISHLKDKISEKTGIDPDKIDVEVRKVDLASLFKK